MAVFKCKMCGGTIEFEDGATVGVCDSCGTKQTLPRLSDDRRANLYDRANHFRRCNDFDKAAGIYEQILNEDSTDAEAYWSLVLCRYGIEYVEDPQSHKRIPTVNRAQFTSVFDDDNYKSALQYADGYQRTIYEEEAKAINDIQKGILAISQKEEPFDVFICYKETDANGRRTPDSVLANDLYYQLKQEGFKVFFARITLEDKLGSAYEPYIFAALNSARVMVVLGTKPEYFGAVWVKNEWSRYLSLVKNSGGKKILIPAYKDMDPYDLPEEFSHLQAQDMSKLGFMQDLIRGIKKIVSAGAPVQTVKETVVVGTNNQAAAPLLERAFLFLEDGKWQDANIYCEKVLDIDPKNAEAYLGKLMAELQVRSRKLLADCSEPFDDRDNFRKIIRFGDEKLEAEMRGYITHIKERIVNDRYDDAANMMNCASTISDYNEAAAAFKSLGDFKDAPARAEECLAKAEECRKEAIYYSAKLKMAGGKIPSYEAAIRSFQTISDYKDSDEQISACRKKIEKIKADAEERRIAAEKAEKKRRKIIAIGASIVCVCVIFIILLNAVIIPSSKYNIAMKLYDAGKYEEAISAFEALDGYLDSKSQINRCKEALNESKYNAAIELYNSGNVIEAYEALIALNGYKDSADKAASVFEKYKAEKLKVADVGDTLFFGKYEQDNVTSNGKEPIEWIVLAKEGSKILVVSAKALDCKQYNTSYTNVTWETCSLRSWMNGTFLNTAFNLEEQQKIANTSVSADENPTYTTNPGNDTTDKVFLLGISEANRYFDSDEARKCIPTAYAKANGAYNSSRYTKGGVATCLWWLRSPGYFQDVAAIVNDGGSVTYYGSIVSYADVCIRPAMWITLDT